LKVFSWQCLLHNLYTGFKSMFAQGVDQLSV
jgi:hypothetical protein